MYRQPCSLWFGNDATKPFWYYALTELILFVDDNYNLMITTQDAVVDGKDAYDVIPTLLAMGQSANVTKDVQRHIVRAIDNLSAHGTSGKKYYFCVESSS